GLAAHVGLPRVAAGLAAAARVLLAAEGAADLGAAGADVHVGDAAVAARRGEEALGRAEVAREHGAGEPLRDAVVDGDRLVDRLDLDRVEDRREGLLGDDRHVAARAHDRRLDEVAPGAGALGVAPAAHEDLPAL